MLSMHATVDAIPHQSGSQKSDVKISTLSCDLAVNFALQTGLNSKVVSLVLKISLRLSLSLPLFSHMIKDQVA